MEGILREGSICVCSAIPICRQILVNSILLLNGNLSPLCELAASPHHLHISVLLQHLTVTWEVEGMLVTCGDERLVVRPRIKVDGWDVADGFRAG